MDEPGTAAPDTDPPGAGPVEPASVDLPSMDPESAGTAGDPVAAL